MKSKTVSEKKTLKKIDALNLGAMIQSDGSVFFRVWAPHCKTVSVKVISSKGNETIPMAIEKKGYFSILTKKAQRGSNYYFVLDEDKQVADPVSRFQPDGIFGASEVISADDFLWTDQKWRGTKLENALIYELHIGTFTEEGSFDGAIKKLPHLKKMGVTCVELMPVAQFPGARNWGNDAVNLFAVQHSYGGPLAFKRFVNACHAERISVSLDIVCHRMGSEGNTLSAFGPYFSSKDKSLNGKILNYSGFANDGVRDFFLSNMSYWIQEYHVDALCLHDLDQMSADDLSYFLPEIGERIVHESTITKRKLHFFMAINCHEMRFPGGSKKINLGSNGLRNADFHRALQAYLTKENRGYYSGYGTIEDVAKAIKKNFVDNSKCSNSRKAKYRVDVSRLSGKNFIQYIQSHNEVGSRAWGDRLSSQISFEAQKIAAVLLLLSPSIPLLWMGQEYGEKAPFRYFVDYRDAGLLQALRQERKKLFADLNWQDLPDPADPETYLNSKLNWELIEKGRHPLMLKFYTDLINLRRKMKILTKMDRKDLKVKFSEEEKWISLQYNSPDYREYGILVSLDERERVISSPFGAKTLLVEILNTEDERYGGFLARKKNRIHSGSLLLSSYGAIIGNVEK